MYAQLQAWVPKISCAVGDNHNPDETPISRSTVNIRAENTCLRNSPGTYELKGLSRWPWHQITSGEVSWPKSLHMRPHEGSFTYCIATIKSVEYSIYRSHHVYVVRGHLVLIRPTCSLLHLSPPHFRAPSCGGAKLNR